MLTDGLYFSELIWLLLPLRLNLHFSSQRNFFLRRSTIMPYQFQAQTPSSHLPSMVDRRMSNIPPPVSHSQIANDHRVSHPPVTLPPISQLVQAPVNLPTINPSNTYFVLPTPAGQSVSNVQAYPLHAYGAASLQAGAGSTFNASAPVPTIRIGSRIFIRGSDREVGKVEFDEPWIEAHTAELEQFSKHHSGEEKGKVYFDIWMDIRKSGLRDKQSIRHVIAKELMPYSWFKGDESISEVLHALHRLEYINAGLLAKKHYENSMWFWDKEIGNIKVRDYWIAEGITFPPNLRAQAQTQAQAQAQQ